MCRWLCPEGEGNGDRYFVLKLSSTTVAIELTSSRLSCLRDWTKWASDLERARDYDPKVPEIHHNLSIAYANACKADGTSALDLALKENESVPFRFAFGV